MEPSEWAGRVGDVWAEEWRRIDRSLEPVNAALVDRAAARLAGVAKPRILDIGCGAGTTGLALARRLPQASITGIDLSPALLDVARARAGDGTACRFEAGDASRWAGARDFDLLVSRHGVMFFADPVGAFRHLHGLARPGAALVFSCFRSPSRNVWASGLAHLMPESAGEPGAPGPFAFADARHVAEILTLAGWRDAAAHPLDFDYVAGAGADPVADAVEFFRRIGPAARALRELADPHRARLEEGLGALVRAHCEGNRVCFPAAAWIWSATA